MDKFRSANQLDHYMASVYLRLLADVREVNQNIPHNALRGTENEKAIARLLRDFLPIRFGIENNAIVIDRFGKASKEIDILIYDSTQPKFFHKVFPIEHVYAVIEVKTTLTSKEADHSLQKLAHLNTLEFSPALTPYWISRTASLSVPQQMPPSCYVFAFDSNSKSFETFAGWFPWNFFNLHRIVPGHMPDRDATRLLRICCLDQGTLEFESSNGFIMKNLAGVVDDRHREYGYKQTCFNDEEISVDPVKALFLFLNRLWFDLQHHNLHPGFDIRSYLSLELGTTFDGNWVAADFEKLDVHDDSNQA